MLTSSPGEGRSRVQQFAGPSAKAAPSGPDSLVPGVDIGVEYAASALAALSEGVVVQVASGEIVSCNPAAERILGLSRDQLKGRTSVDPGWRAIHEDGSPFPGETHPAMVTLRTGEPLRGVVMGVHTPEGSLRWISINSGPVPGSGAHPASVVTTFVDITDRRVADEAARRGAEAIRRSEEKYRRIVDTANEGIWQIDAKSNLTFVNQQMADMLGYTPEELLGRNPVDFVVSEERADAGRRIAEAAQGLPESHERRFVRKDGSEVWVQLARSPILSPEGTFSGVLAMATDITERKRVEVALRKSEDDFRWIFERSIIGKTITFPSGESHVNDAFARMLGYGREELERLGQRGITHPDDLGESHRIVASFLSGESNEAHFTKRYIHRDGSVVWAEISTNVRRGADGRPLYFVSVANEISERRRLEAALEESEAKYRLLAENSTDVIGILGTDGIVKYASPSCLALTGYGQQEMIGRRVSDIFLPEEWPVVEEAMARHAAGDDVVRVRYRVRHKDGSLIWVERISRALRESGTGKVAEFHFSVRDVTETKLAEDEVKRHRDHLEEVVVERTASLQKTNAALTEVIAVQRRTEGELRESEERLHLAQEASQSGAYEWDVRTDEVLWTPELERLYGLPEGGFAGRYGSWEAFVHPEDLPRINALVQKAVEEKTGFQSQFRITRGDGETCWMELFGRVFCDETGQPLRVIGVNRDITERKRAEEVHAASRRAADRKTEELRALFESTAVGMALYDATPPFRLLSCNQRFQESYPEPLRTAGMVGLTLPEFAPEAVTGGVLDAFQRVVDTGAAISFREFPYEGFAGGRSWWDWHVAPVVSKGKVVALAFGRVDVSLAVRARKRIETEMYHVKEANRDLEAFSYSVSHDLRAPLRAINGFTSLLERRLGDALDEESHRLVDVVKENSRLMGALVDGLLEYTRIRHIHLARTRLDMKRIAESVVTELVADAQRQQVEVRVAELPSAYADPGLTVAILKHLLSNAFKFSACRPKPVVEVGFEAGPDGPVYFVKDNGVGFDPKYMEKLFGVFHRLDGPPEARGTGIGLALVRRIVERHGGWIRAEGAVNGGAKFRFSLVPASTEPDVTLPV